VSEDGPGWPRPDAVGADVRSARTLPAATWTDPAELRRQAVSHFVPSWQLVPPGDVPELPGEAVPITLLRGLLDEPLALVRDEAERLRVLGNACTHRGALVVERRCALRRLRCRYHGRTFHVDGTFAAAPGFEGAEGFPRPEDDLPVLPLATLGPLTFTSLAPAGALDELLAPVRERMGFLDWAALAHDGAADRDYEVRAHWALYVDNYLEGLHVPFIHPDLDATLDWSGYRYELFERVSLQLSPAADGEPAFDLPEGHPQHGERIAAFYWFVFPNLTLNFYPWGLSVNLIEPLAVDRTRVRYFPFVADTALRERGAGGALHAVELEDEQVVESAQAGLRSRLWRPGRFAPAHEAAVHQFHRLLAGG